MAPGRYNAQAAANCLGFAPDAANAMAEDGARRQEHVGAKKQIGGAHKEGGSESRAMRIGSDERGKGQGADEWESGGWAHRRRRDAPRPCSQAQRRIREATSPGPPGSDKLRNGRSATGNHLGSNVQHDILTAIVGGSTEALFIRGGPN